MEPGDGGLDIGRDPRRMSQDDVRALGHEPMSPLAALRARCLDCCAGSPNEVRLCTAIKCPAWPFRMGSSPWRQAMTDEQLAAARARAQKNLATASKADKSRGSDTTVPEA
jgi:hypothetical protein